MIRWLIASVLLAGCGPGESPDAPLLADVEAGVRALDRAFGFTTSFIGSGVIDARAPDDVIAAAIYQRFKAETGTCAQASVDIAVVRVDLGAGCTLATANFIAGGTATATVTHDARGGVNLLFDLALTVDRGQALSGRISAVSVPSGFGYTADVTLAGTKADVPNLEAGQSSGSGVLRGSGKIVGRATWDLTLNGVRQSFSLCYPDAGSVTLDGGTRRVTVNYTDATRESGAVTLSESGAPTHAGTLPPRTGCPPK